MAAGISAGHAAVYHVRSVLDELHPLFRRGGPWQCDDANAHSAAAAQCSASKAAAEHCAAAAEWAFYYKDAGYKNEF